MLSKKFIVMHKVSIAIFLFISLISIIHYMKPTLIYLEDGSFRNFGIGYRNKTVVPIWVTSIFLAILSYLLVLYVITYY